MDAEGINGSPRPKRSLGQNFLTSPAALERIVLAANLEHGETVLEIGPGKGALTRKLLEKGANVVAIEKDRRMAALMNEIFAVEIASGRLRVIEGDVLDADIAETVGEGPYKLVANIPYYVTGAIFRKFLESDRRPTAMVLLVQKEVALRAVAKEGKGSLLSLSVKAYGKPSMKGTVKAGSFFPKPKVDSAILSIADISGAFFKDVDERAFFEVIKAAFGRKRKQLRSVLSEHFGAERTEKALAEAGIAPSARAEDLRLDEWARIARAFA